LAISGAHAAIGDVQQTATLERSRNPHRVTVRADGVVAGMLAAEVQHVLLERA
jgi:carbon monoxide dehydrogenase subunit G